MVRVSRRRSHGAPARSWRVSRAARSTRTASARVSSTATCSYATFSSAITKSKRPPARRAATAALVLSRKCRPSNSELNNGLREHKRLSVYKKKTLYNSQTDRRKTTVYFSKFSDCFFFILLL